MTVVYINAVQYQTCPDHESDYHFFAKIPGGGPDPRFPPPLWIRPCSLHLFLSHNNPCFPCNIAITNFLILYTCEIRFYDVIDRTVHTFTSDVTSSYTKIPKHGQKSMFWTPIFQYKSLNSVM